MAAARMVNRTVNSATLATAARRLAAPRRNTSPRRGLWRASMHLDFFLGGAFSEGPLTPLVGSCLARERQLEQSATVVRHRPTSVVAFSL